MNTGGISNYNIGGSAPLNRTTAIERPRETARDEPAPPPPTRPSTVVEISAQGRELARAAEVEQQNKRVNNAG